MSDYAGPSEDRIVRVVRQLGEIAADTVCKASFYPELKQYMVKVPGKHYNYSCMADSGYVEDITTLS